ncbi:MAG: FliM/FliN family flagellar motor switch protein [Planctomycetes bacterium]|nr:FliM/FliN family flagellar motor switch protein [Planctomycetota bacterium]
MDRSAPQPPALADWLANAIHSPAFIPAERALPIHHRVFAAWATHACAMAARSLFNRPVTLAPTESFAGPVFAATLRHDGHDAAVIAFDLPAARAIADALSVSLVGVRGAGTISPAEAALLEYACLELLDRVLSASGLADCPLVLGGFQTGEDAASRVSTGASLPLSLTIAGHAGGAHVRLPQCAPQIPPLLPASPLGAHGAVSVSLALPTFALADSELAEMQPGDIVLPGLTDLASAAGCRLVTRTLWCLADAAIAADAPGHIQVRCGPVNVRPDAPLADPAPPAHRTACVLIGDSPASVTDLTELAADRFLSIRKRPGEEATLLVDARAVARGELVRCENEIGVRITQRIGGAS